MEKNKRKVILVGLLCLVIALCIVGYNMLNKPNSNNKSMAIYMPNANGEGYTLSNYSTIPSGYMLNETESYCEYGSTLFWNDNNNTVGLIANKSDKCYMYLDKEADPITVSGNTLKFNRGSFSSSFDTTKEEVIEKTFTVSANSSPSKVALYFKDLVNTYTPSALTYTLSYSTTKDGSYTSVATDINIPRRSKASSTAKIKEVEIPANTTYYYKVAITYHQLTGVNQTRDETAQFKTGFTIKAVNESVAVTPPGNYMKDFCEYGEWVDDYDGTVYYDCLSDTYDNNYVFGNSNFKKSDIYAIKFVDYSTPPSGTTYVTNGSPWDVSEAQNGSVKAWIVSGTYVYNVRTGTTRTGNILYIGQDGGVVANPDSTSLFERYTNLRELDAEKFLTSYVTNMQMMFQRTGYLHTLNIGGWDVSQVTDMSSMFYNLANNYSGANLTLNIDLTSWDVSNVTDMSYMFNGFKGVSINMSGLDTSSVTNMASMFSSMSVTNLNINFDTSNVTNMSSMFSSLGLSSLDLSSFDTANVTNMNYMFSYCAKLTSLDLANFDTSNVTSMNYMFNNWGSSSTSTLYGSIDLDLSSFDTASVENMNSMFYNGYNFRTIDVSSFDTADITNLHYLFNNVFATELDLSNFVIKSGADIEGILNATYYLEKLTLSEDNYSLLTSSTAYNGYHAENFEMYIKKSNGELELVS